MLKNEQQKKLIFSSILYDDKLSAEMMDSLMKKQSHMMMSGKADQKMNMEMMKGMMDMAEKDTTMCKMMVHMMQQRPEIMKQMKDKNPIVPGKEEHSGHHPK